MARALTRTKLPLDRWAQIMGISPLHFNQVFSSSQAESEACGLPIFQYPYQAADRVGREDIAMAIRTAEEMIEARTRYLLAPEWRQVENQPAVRPLGPDLFAVGPNVRGQGLSVILDRGHVIAGGVVAKTLIQAAAPITYTDVDGDGYQERAQVAVATTVTDANEIAVYFPGQAGADEWEVRPITVTIAGGTATVTMRREQLVSPNLWERLNAVAVDGQTAANFLTTIDVYQRFHDPSKQVRLIWEPPTCGCGLTGCPACLESGQDGCILVRNPRLGAVVYSPGTWNATTLSFDAGVWAGGRAPDRLQVWYRSGWIDWKRARPYVEMDPYWEHAVAYLAAALIDRPICSCDTVAAWVARWATDLTLQPLDGPRFQIGAGSNRSVPNRVLDNPFGPTRGAQFAWDRIMAEGRAIGSGV